MDGLQDSKSAHRGSYLSDDDATSLHWLTTKHLDTSALCVGISTILRTSTSLHNGEGPHIRS